jgi:DNA helicase-2/ATP-dependent DNA helicase PcrA
MTTFSPSAEQYAVIHHPLEPLRVAAGAGSGKTGTMALRLAHFVTNGSIEPEQALGITFTNKAAGELAERVRLAVPVAASEGREVEITTYHGFAHGLLAEFGPLVGVPRGVRIVTPGYTRQLIRDVIGAGPRPLLDLTQPGRVADRVARLASTLGDHLRSAADLFSESDDPVALERNALADVLEAYERRKAALGVVDFADLVTLAHRLVTEHEGLAERIRDRYRLVLLDEYQDTNPGQRELLRSIFGEGFPVTAVGDTDQTIYEWRGASPDNFERFGMHFPRAGGAPAESRNLSVTWRNDRAIVTVANAVRGQLHAPGPLASIEARPDAAGGTVVTHWAHSARVEAAWIADQAERLHAGGTPWREMAVLFRKHRQMAEVRDALVARGIPVEVASLGGLLEVPEVVDLHAWLRILGRPDDAVALARILTGSTYRLGLGDLAPLSGWVRKRNRVEPDDETAIGWALLEAVDELESVDGLSSEAVFRIGEFRRLYRTLLSAAQGVSLVDLCRVVLDQTGTWPEVDALEDAARLSARLNLYRFLDLAEEWSPLEGAPSLPAFLDHLELLADEASSGELDTARVSGEDAMPLLTVHRAKGLEWDVVFLPALCHDVFPSRVIQYEDPVTVPSVVPHGLRLDTASLCALPDDPDQRRAILRQAHDDQEWRTAYVAVTRARHTLVGSGAYWIGGTKPRSPSRLFEILDEAAGPDPRRCSDPGAPPTDTPSVRSAEAPDPVFPTGWRTAFAATIIDPTLPETLARAAGLSAAYDAGVDQLRMMLAGLPEPGPRDAGEAAFRTSVTGLVTLAGCPKRFQWSEIDRLPRRPSPSARRGAELHRRIELHNRGTVALDDVDDGFYDSVGEASGAVPDAFARYKASRFAESRPLLIEAPFDLSVAGARVAGRIDAVYEPAPGSWEIVDFKSGRPTDDDSRHVQLEAYAVAATEAGFHGGSSPDRIRVTFAYLGADELVEVGEDVDEAWLADARNHLNRLVAEARSGTYPATPSAGCRHCDFSRFCTAGAGWLEQNQ